MSHNSTPVPVITVPTMWCRYCRYVLRLEQVKGIDGMYTAEHPTVTDYQCEVNFEFWFCPNNAKSWRVMFPQYTVTEVY